MDRSDIFFKSMLFTVEQPIMKRVKGCYEFPRDKDPGNTKLTGSQLQEIGLIPWTGPDGQPVRSVEGYAYTCSTPLCNSAISPQISSVLCALLIFAAVIVKRL